MHRSRLLATAAVAGLVLAGCGGITPGAAATVDGEAIPLSRVDEMARAFCAADLAAARLQDQPPQAQGTADYRNRVLATLVNARVAQEAVDDLGVDVPDSAAQGDLSQFDDLFAELSEDEATALRDYIEVFGVLDASTQAIGREEGGPKAADSPEAAAAAGQDFLREQAKKSDIELDPRFGDFTDGQVVAGSGSLSVPASGQGEDAAPAPDAPASQSCG